MRNLKQLFRKNKGGMLLAVFPHPDDESFVAGGLLRFAGKSGIKVKVISLTDSRTDEKAAIKESEFRKAVRILNVHGFEIWKYKEGQIKNFQEEISDKLKKEISSSNPFAVITFDPNGITGHPDHIVTSVILLNIIKKLRGNRPKLLWRISDKAERKHFVKSQSQQFTANATYVFNLPLSLSIVKLRAIFAYETQFKNLLYRLRILDWYLFDHKEGYYAVDLEKINFRLSTI